MPEAVICVLEVLLIFSLAILERSRGDPDPQPIRFSSGPPDPWDCVFRVSSVESLGNMVDTDLQTHSQTQVTWSRGGWSLNQSRWLQVLLKYPRPYHLSFLALVSSANGVSIHLIGCE